MVERVFKIIVSVDEDGWFVSECLDLPGCISQGKTEREAIDNLHDAIDGYVAGLKKHGEQVPVAKERHYVDLPVSF